MDRLQKAWDAFLKKITPYSDTSEPWEESVSNGLLFIAYDLNRDYTYSVQVCFDIGRNQWVYFYSAKKFVNNFERRYTASTDGLVWTLENQTFEEIIDDAFECADLLYGECEDDV